MQQQKLLNFCLNLRSALVYITYIICNCISTFEIFLERHIFCTCVYTYARTCSDDYHEIDTNYSSYKSLRVELQA